MKKEYKIPVFMWIRKKTKKDLKKIKKLWTLKSLGDAVGIATSILLKDDLLKKENEDGKK